MNEIKTAAELKAKIAELEQKAKGEEAVLKQQFVQTKTALKPAHLIKNSFSTLAQTPEVRKTLIGTIVGFGLGYFSKKAHQMMNEDSMNRLVHGVLEQSMNRVVQHEPNSFLAKGIMLTRQVAREKGIRLFDR